jgi:hypothetical protein
LEPLRADAVQRDERLLILALHLYGVDARTAVRFQDCFAVGAVGLIASAIGLHVVRRQERNIEVAR